MGRQVKSAWDRLHWPQVAVLAIFVGGVVASLRFTPEHLVEKIVELDWRAAAGGLVAFLSAVVGIGVRAGILKPRVRGLERWEADGYDDEPPTDPAGPRALERATRPPGDSAPPRRRDGFAAPPALLAIAAVAAILLACALLATGCVSEVRVHATIASTAGATIDTWCQEEVERRDRDQRAAADAHETREDAAAAVAAVRASYEDELGACTAARGIHDGWVEAITLGAAGAPFDAVDVALRFLGPFVGVWEGLERASAQSEHPIPPLPDGLPELAALASGGAR